MSISESSYKLVWSQNYKCFQKWSSSIFCENRNHIISFCLPVHFSPKVQKAIGVLLEYVTATSWTELKVWLLSITLLFFFIPFVFDFIELQLIPVHVSPLLLHHHVSSFSTHNILYSLLQKAFCKMEMKRQEQKLFGRKKKLIYRLNISCKIKCVAKRSKSRHWFSEAFIDSYCWH